MGTGQSGAAAGAGDGPVRKHVGHVVADRFQERHRVGVVRIRLATKARDEVGRQRHLGEDCEPAAAAAHGAQPRREGLCHMGPCASALSYIRGCDGRVPGTLRACTRGACAPVRPRRRTALAGECSARSCAGKCDGPVSRGRAASGRAGFLQGRQPAPTLQMLSRSFINASSSSGKSLGCGEVNRMRTSGTAVETLFSMRTTQKRVIGR